MNVECGKERHLKCNRCNASFYYKQDLRKHLARMHGRLM
ncbi:hypothetical protein TcasGA2_TC003102 [Tribolium castaneum]|uniref:C2H2-type domain-containing protein n=2 Tax=Tribolium castaneum TaxID=7070 RepID=D6WFD0_TRICA|nr:hypothetical protein TcasGA2_TC003102 [Tribolium castaneum]